MENLKKYNIKFVGLKVGNHEFDYKIGKEFFDAFEYSEIKKGNVDVKLEMEKSSSMLVLNFNISGQVSGLCDLCSDEMDVSIEGGYQQIVKFSDEVEESESEDITILPTSEYEINVAHYLFEFIHLSLPIKKVHEEGDCNEDVKEILSDYLLTESPEEGEAEDSGEVDPRWAALMALKKDNK